MGNSGSLPSVLIHTSSLLRMEAAIGLIVHNLISAKPFLLSFDSTFLRRRLALYFVSTFLSSLPRPYTNNVSIQQPSRHRLCVWHLS